ncbi:hypothetical protein ABK040_010871 [Willaertia magna]
MGNDNSSFEDDSRMDNHKFYTNKIPSIPNGDFLQNIHLKWFGNWKLLERHHGYIQFLFPIRLAGLNDFAQPLTFNEVKVFRKDEEIKYRFIKSYKLMLDFYGLVLEDELKGVVSRNPATYKDRYYHLNSSFHNYLRITRILKCMGVVLGEHYKVYLLNHFVVEMFKYNQLQNAKDSLIRYWLPTLRKQEHLIYFDNLIEELSNNKRKIDRNNRDGHGDEYGQDNWQTQYYETEEYLNVNLFEDEYLKSKDILTHPKDPYSDKRF